MADLLIRPRRRRPARASPRPVLLVPHPAPPPLQSQLEAITSELCSCLPTTP